MKAQKLVIGVVLVLAGVGLVAYGLSRGDSYSPAETTTTTSTSEAPAETSQAVDPPRSYSQQGELEDVSGGNASGVAQAGYDNGEYFLFVEMNNLPELEEGFFYEGWVVNQATSQFISTGMVEKETAAAYTNAFSTTERDYTDYSFYVLTLEPDDGDPAPAEHILEGLMN